MCQYLVAMDGPISAAKEVVRDSCILEAKSNEEEIP
jgi:hypothetical protein